MGSGSSALVVGVAVLDVELKAIEGLLGTLLSLSHDLVLLLLFLFAGFDVGGIFARRIECSWDRRKLLALHHGVTELGEGRLLLILLVANDVGTCSVDDHGVDLSDHGH